MTLADLSHFITANSFYPLLSIRDEPPYFYVTLGRGAAEYTFALSQDQLRDAFDWQGLVRDHLIVATEDLGKVDGAAPMPMWA